MVTSVRLNLCIKSFIRINFLFFSILWFGIAYHQTASASAMLPTRPLFTGFDTVCMSGVSKSQEARHLFESVLVESDDADNRHIILGSLSSIPQSAIPIINRFWKSYRTCIKEIVESTPQGALVAEFLVETDAIVARFSTGSLSIGEFNQAIVTTQLRLLVDYSKAASSSEDRLGLSKPSRSPVELNANESSTLGNLGSGKNFGLSDSSRANEEKVNAEPSTSLNTGRGESPIRVEFNTKEGKPITEKANVEVHKTSPEAYAKRVTRTSLTQSKQTCTPPCRDKKTKSAQLSSRNNPTQKVIINKPKHNQHRGDTKRPSSPTIANRQGSWFEYS